MLLVLSLLLSSSYNDCCCVPLYACHKQNWAHMKYVCCLCKNFYQCQEEFVAKFLKRWVRFIPEFQCLIVIKAVILMQPRRLMFPRSKRGFSCMLWKQLAYIEYLSKGTKVKIHCHTCTLRTLTYTSSLAFDFFLQTLLWCDKTVSRRDRGWLTQVMVDTPQIFCLSYK